MIILDTMALITFLQRDKDSAEYKNLVAHVKQLKNSTIGLPIPALAEFIAGDNNEARSYELLKSSSRFKNLNFDEKSGLIAARIYREYRETLTKQAQNQRPNQKVKVDIQILGIAIANKATSITTNDKHIKNIIKSLNLPISIFDYIENSFVEDMTTIIVTESNNLPS